MLEKLPKNLSWFEDWKVSSCSVAQLLGVRTMSSEVVRKTSQGASHVSVRRGFRRRLIAKKEDEEIPRCCMASVKQSAIRAADFEKITSINNWPRPARVEFVLAMHFAAVSVPSVPDRFFTSLLPSSEHFPVVL